MLFYKGSLFKSWADDRINIPSNFFYSKIEKIMAAM